MDCVSCFKFLSQSCDFGCDFLVSGCFRQLFNLLAFFLLFSLGLKVLQLGYHFKGLTQFLCDFRGKSSDLRNGFCSKNCLDGKCNKNISTCGLLEFWKNSEPTMIGQLKETEGIAKGNGDVKAKVVSNGEYDDDSNELGCHDDDDGDEEEEVDVKAKVVSNGEYDDDSNELGCHDDDDEDEEVDVNAKIVSSGEYDDDSNELGCHHDDDDDEEVDVKAKVVSSGEYDDDSTELGCHDDDDDEDEEIDVVALRKLVKIERQRANAADLELEKERIAAATAAEEAMAMILRLQNEKSLIEMEAKQCHRLAEEKQLHDQEVIQSLRWIVMKHESERSLLEDQLRFFRQKLKLCMSGDEGDQSKEIDEYSRFFNLSIADSLGDALISSLDMDLSPRWNENLQNDGVSTR